MAAFDKFETRCDYANLLRNAMMYHDIQYYFDAVWTKRWYRLTPREFDFLSSKYGEAVVRSVCERHRLTVGEEAEPDYLLFLGL